MYKIQEFARLAGVTVKTLHHYDRLGILSPVRRTAGGYRLYDIGDLAQIERILVLRYLGLSLRDIGRLLSGTLSQEESLHETLGRQGSILRARRDGIDRVLRAIEGVQHQLEDGASVDSSQFQAILKEIDMQEHDWMDKYYSQTGLDAVEEHKKDWDPALQPKITADWDAMFAKVNDAVRRNVDPRSAEGKALAEEWMGLVRQFTRGNPEIHEGLNNMYADVPNWPQSAKEHLAGKSDAFEFIKKVQGS